MKRSILLCIHRLDVSAFADEILHDPRVVVPEKGKGLIDWLIDWLID